GNVREVAAALGPYLLVVALSFLWALTEILQTFRSDIRRALRSGWSALLIGVNVLFALLVFALARYLAPPSVNPYLLALGVGAGWQALLRTRINLLQPLTPEAGEAVSLSLSDLYGRFQGFCREQIDRSLLSGRVRLLEQAVRLPVEELEYQVRLFAHASVLRSPDEVEAYLKKLRQLGAPERALALASYLLAHGGYDLLQERLKAMEKGTT
ncbi:MAG: hypothetical protein J7575_09370, partial [Chloroflexi bacterium]|nr:hypothetical protein [Chloroflexota bacterium]